MSLSRHIKSENVVRASLEHPLHKAKHAEHGSDQEAKEMEAGSYNSRYETQRIPAHRMPTHSTSEQAAYQLVHDELDLDGRPNMNLASFVHTHMNEYATKLMVENMSKNLIDGDEYQATQKIHTRCVSMLAHLWHAPHSETTIGTATTGSSEAIQLGGLAMLRRWEARQKKAGKSIHEPGPNIIMGANAQVALEKFARYWAVENRLVPVTEESRFRLDPKRAMQYVDENTIGVFVILGSTYTGHYEPVKEMADLLDEYEKKTGIFVPIHVDGASGAFVAPFATPNLLWDFKIPRVVSINTSGHKFGLAYVGVGWVVWRDKEHLPKDLIFELHYLGSIEYSFSLNFSRPAAPILAQYYSLIQLGFEGYRRIALADLKNARLFSRVLENTGYYKVLSDIHRPVDGKPLTDPTNIDSYQPGLPVVAFAFSDDFKAKYPHIQQKWIQTMLRVKEFIVPNYELPPDVEKLETLRVVVRESLSEPLLEKLIEDLIEVTESLMSMDSPDHALAILASHTTQKSSAGGGRPSGMKKDDKGQDSIEGYKPQTSARPC